MTSLLGCRPPEAARDLSQGPPGSSHDPRVTVPGAVSVDRVDDHHRVSCRSQSPADDLGHSAPLATATSGLSATGRG